MLPEGWARRSVQEMGAVHAGRQRSPGFTEGALRPYLRVANVFDGWIDLADVYSMRFTEEEFKRYKLEPGDVLLNEGQSLELVGRPALFMGPADTYCFQNTLVRFTPSKQVLPMFAQLKFQQCLYDGTFQGIAKKTTSIAHLGVSRFADLELTWPPIDEQRAIVKVLESWTKAIATTEKLLANSRRQKQDLMQGLLSGHRGFDSTKSRWAQPDFDDVFERIIRKNAVGNQNVLTISGRHGLISQREYFNKSVASENLQGYTLLERGDFAYNKSYSAGYPVGAIKPLLAYESGVVSSLYICFRIRPNIEADADFFRHYFEAGMLNDAITGIAQEGARNHGLLNVSVKDFFKLKLRVPTIEAQRRIAEVLNAAESEERCIERQLEKLKQEKRALMADLLTGKRRVRVPEASAEAEVI